MNSPNSRNARSARSARSARLLAAGFLGLALGLPALHAQAQNQALAPAGTGAASASAAAPSTAAQVISKNLAPGFVGLSASDKLVLVPMDVELFELGVGGVSEPKAEWTAAALRFMKSAIAEKKTKLKLGLIEMNEEQADEFAEQLGLQAAVQRAIALHHLNPGAPALPTKAGQLDWSLGDAMQPLAAKTGARYGLFIWVRDYYASAERKAMMVGMALLGIGIPGGVQVGYASLVDLHSGQVVWMNRLASAFGDLREAKPAQASVDALLENFPVVR
jgi:hypothetical protein